MRKQDSIESLSSLSKAPPICAMTTRMMQTPLVKSTKSIRFPGLPSILSFNIFYFAIRAQRYLINWNKNGEDKEN